MEKASVFQHLPNRRITPIVGYLLREYLDFKIVVSALKHIRARENFVYINTHHVLARLFECILKRLLILFCFALPVRNEPVSIANENEDTSLVGSIKRGDISNRVRVHENQAEFFGRKDFIVSALKVSLYI